MDNGPREQPVTKTNPDPSIATNDALERATKSERDYVDGKIETLNERLRGMDTATELLSQTAKGMPSQWDDAVGHLADLMAVKFKSIEDQLTVAETLRVEQKNDSTVGLAAALSSQKELAGAENTSNKLAISKSEEATAETIKTNQELTRSKTDELTKGLDEVKLAISRIESVKQGGKEALSGVQVLLATGIAAGGLVAAVYLASQP